MCNVDLQLFCISNSSWRRRLESLGRAATVAGLWIEPSFSAIAATLSFP
jgi:hypothetical protein